MRNLIRINFSNIHLLTAFLESLNEEKLTFRYFNSRSVNVIKNHIITCLLCENETPCTYGHLEKKGPDLWLGITTIKEKQGKGYGREMMFFLINHAKELNESSISLTVDKSNLVAIKLYEENGFHLDLEFETYNKYKLYLK